MNASTSASAPSPELPPGKRRSAVTGSGIWAAFVGGLTGSSALSLIVAFAVAAVVCVLGSRRVTESWVIDHGDLLSRGAGDLELDITRTMLKLKRESPARPAVALLGRLGRDQPYAADELDAVWHGLDATLPDVVELRLPAETLYEALVLTDQFPTGWRVQPVIVLSVDDFFVSPRSYVTTENRPRLGVRSHLAAFELRSVGLQPVPLRWNYFVDNQSFLLSRGRAVITNLVESRLGHAKRSRDETAQVLRPPYRTTQSHNLVSAYVNLRMLEHMVDHLNKVCGRPAILVFLTEGKEGDLTFQTVAPKLVKIATQRGAKLGWVKPGGEQRGGLPIEVWQALRYEARQLQESQP
jgi:hypothetical protein